jgi:hypothetical protein
VGLKAKGRLSTGVTFGYIFQSITLHFSWDRTKC